MRCIETNIAQRDNRSMSKINYNMRCIETHPEAPFLSKFP